MATATDKKPTATKREIADRVLNFMEKGRKITRINAAKALKIPVNKLRAIERKIFIRVAIAVAMTKAEFREIYG